MAVSAVDQIWQNADAYEAYMGRWSRPIAASVLAWLNIAPGSDWLDAGCGTGALTQAILDSTDPREILGVDPSADFLSTASAHVSDPRVRFEIGDARALPAPNDSYDAVVSGLVLHFIPDPGAAVLDMTRTAKRGGTVAAYVWDVDHEEQFTRYFWQAAIAVDPAADAQNPSSQWLLKRPEPFAEVFESAGLSSVSVESVQRKFLFRDFDDYWQPILLRGPGPPQRYVASLEAEQQAALREQLRSILPIAADGSIPLSGRVWAARGTK